ncbi:hypothetical protein [Christiangramia sp. SM2212]|uniref:Lipoprotein n=1 Tax=Christiangramia sediminicola TaxID=3073267 RepID=A0ABU1ER25_9FLAO|nr:hypothetical protein [Christiangramia sp. SM2212]MDR5590424.1 hypothetical protein [Christiangramia sp. SM2212]
MKKLYFNYLFSLVFFIVALSCNTNDDANELSENYLKANVNGLDFNSDNNLTSLIFTREIRPSGLVNLNVKAISEDGDVIEFLVENFKGVGKYYFGDNLYNNSWIKYKRSSTSEEWMVLPKGALNLNTNYIEITFNEKNRVEGKISCKELKSLLEDIFGAVEGEFRLSY